MAARNQVRRGTTRALKAPSQCVIYQNGKENTSMKNSSAGDVSMTKSKMAMAPSKPQPAPQRPRRRTVLSETSSNAVRVLECKPVKEKKEPCPRKRKTEASANSNLRNRSMVEPRKVLGELTNNVLVNKPPKKLVPTKSVAPDFVIRRRDVLNHEKKLKPVKPLKRVSETEVLINPELHQSGSPAAPSVATVTQNLTPLTVKLNQLCLIAEKGESETTFSSSRYTKTETASLPYAPDFLRIPEYLEEIHEYLIRRELQSFREVDFLCNSSVNPRWRAILTDWLVSVSVHFNLTDETLHVAILLLDSLLRVNNSLTRRIIQLVGVTCLFIASKYEEKYPRSSRDFVETTDGTYTVDNITAMERFILTKVQFNIPLPSALMFYRRGFKIVVFHHPGVYSYPDLFFTGSLILDLAMVDYEACIHAPSKLGAACLVLSMMINQLDLPVVQIWSKIQSHMQWSIPELKPALITLYNIVDRSYSEPRQPMNVLKKFALPKYNRVSMAPHMNPIRWCPSVSLQIKNV